MTVWVTAGCWPVHAVLSRVGWIMKWNHFLWCFFSAEVDLKSKSVKKFCSVVWNRVHINIFVLRGCRSTITDCFFCSAEPSVMTEEIQKNKLYFHSSSTASCSIPKVCRLVYIRKLSGVFQHSRQKQEDASTVKEDNLMSAAAVGFLP